MEFIRLSCYSHPTRPPLTTVIATDDITVSRDEYIEQMTDFDEAYVAVDVFDYEGDIVGATNEAMQRMANTADDERNQTVLYFYDVQSLEICTEDGLLSTSIPSPLTREQILPVLRQIAKHPNYKLQTVVVHDEDANPVTMVRGQIEERSDDDA